MLGSGQSLSLICYEKFLNNQNSTQEFLQDLRVRKIQVASMPWPIEVVSHKTTTQDQQTKDLAYLSSVVSPSVKDDMIYINLATDFCTWST